MTQQTADYATMAAELVKTMIQQGNVKDPASLPKLLEDVGNTLKKVQGASVAASPAPAQPAAIEQTAQPQEEAREEAQPQARQEAAPDIRPVSETGQKPAVPIRQSVQPDYIVCLEDGKQMKMLKRHLRSAYGMTPEQYRAKWGLPPNYPMVAPNYAKQKSRYAKRVGLGTHRMREEVSARRG